MTVRAILGQTALQRALVAFALGLVAGVAIAPFGPWQMALLVGWSVAGAFYAASVWLDVGRFDAPRTRAASTREDNSRVETQVLVLSASVASLAGTALDLVKASQAHGPGKAGLTAVGIATVVVSWFVVHTTFALRYAHEYYVEPVGGIDFKQAGYEPDYQDFAYLAFTVGMTFQVSDTDIKSPLIRRTVLRQSLLSYLFGAVILAVTVNALANLLQ